MFVVHCRIASRSIWVITCFLLWCGLARADSISAFDYYQDQTVRVPAPTMTLAASVNAPGWARLDTG